MICDCCGIHQACDVASMPFVPISISYCIPCIYSNNYPMWLLVANTAMIGGLDEANSDWQDMVYSSLQYQDVSLDQFNDKVQKIVLEMEQEICQA